MHYWPWCQPHFPLLCMCSCLFTFKVSSQCTWKRIICSDMFFLFEKVLLYSGIVSPSVVIYLVPLRSRHFLEWMHHVSCMSQKATKWGWHKEGRAVVELNASTRMMSQNLPLRFYWEAGREISSLWMGITDLKIERSILRYSSFICIVTKNVLPPNANTPCFRLIGWGQIRRGVTIKPE